MIQNGHNPFSTSPSSPVLLGICVCVYVPRLVQFLSAYTQTALYLGNSLLRLLSPKKWKSVSPPFLFCQVCSQTHSLRQFAAIIGKSSCKYMKNKYMFVCLFVFAHGFRSGWVCVCQCISSACFRVCLCDLRARCCKLLLCRTIGIL